MQHVINIHMSNAMCHDKQLLCGNVSLTYM